MDMPGEKLVIKLWETVAEKGIGGLFRPWQMRREGRASIELKREEIVMIAQAERDADVIRKGESLSSFALPSTAIVLRGHAEGSVEGRAAEVLVAETVRREANVTRALLHAEQVLEEDAQQPSEDDVSEDWLFRWRDSASQVSREELQNLWGRVLAGEVKVPGTYSLRTLDFLKNISQKEAEDIGKLSPFVINGRIYRGQQDDLNEFGITFDFLLRMQELGLLAGVEALGMSTSWASPDPAKFSKTLISSSHALTISAEDSSKQITLPTYVVTAIGIQVLSLGNSESNVPYLRKIGEHFKTQGFTVSLSRYTKVDETSVRLFGVESL